MRTILALFIAAAMAASATVQAQPAYYCDPLHVYYPTVARCPVPWRPVYPTPSPTLTPSAQPATASWQQGAADWRSLQAWFYSQSGDRRAGADFWAANRSTAGHPSCEEAAELAGNKAEFIAGCLDAKARLDPIDAKRLSEPEYRAGFNSAARSAPLSAPPAVASNGPGTPSGAESTAPPETATNSARESDNGQASSAEPGAQAPPVAPATQDQVVPSPSPSSTEPLSDNQTSEQSEQSNNADAMILVVLVVGLALYFLPTLIAGFRQHHNAAAIFALNLLLGWTFLGWVVALVWSLTAVERPRQAT
jgi:hypothetical protein